MKTPTPIIPGYELRECLGRGGASVVYKGLEKHSGQTVAIKILRKRFNHDFVLQRRFQEEFRILRNLDHPNLAAVYDYGFAVGGAPFIVMDYVDGASLDRYHQGNPADVWVLLYQITEVLAFIHERDLLHLDLKPGNIVVKKTDAYGPGIPVPVLLDFGLSYKRGTREQASGIGTPAYTAPEMIDGSGKKSRALDYYSFGVTIYELIEGHPPFVGTTREVLHGHLTREASFGRERIEFVELYPRVKGMLSKNPADRVDAYKDLRRFLYARVGTGLEALNKAYGFGYLDSLGLIGKVQAWTELSGWVREFASQAPSRAGDRPPGKKQLSDKKADTGLPILDTAGAFGPRDEVEIYDTDGAGLAFNRAGDVTTDVEDYVKKIIISKLETVRVREDKPGPVHAGAGTRVKVVTGASGSGKSYLTDMLASEGKLNGLTVKRFGEGGDYKDLVTDRGKASGTGPMEAAVAERFARGWHRLKEWALETGVLLIADGYERIEEEERLFVDYVARRLEHASGGGPPERVNILITGNNPSLKNRLKKDLPSLAAVDDVHVGPPGADAVQSLLEYFKRSTAESHDLERLQKYVGDHRESAGALVGALKKALLSGRMELAGGTWRVGMDVGAAGAGRASDAAYYRSLFDGLAPEDRDVVAWLACSPAAVEKESLLSISAVDEKRLQACLQRLAPYGIIAVDGAGGRVRLAIESAAARESLYGLLDPAVKKTIHSAYVGLLDENRGTSAADRIEIFGTLAFHRVALGERREALRSRIQELRCCVAANDLFGIRKSSRAGLAEVRCLFGGRAGRRRWHWERFFIKEAIRAERVSGHNKRLAAIFEKEITAKKRGLPLPLAIDYAHALFKLGRLAEYDKIARGLEPLCARASVDARAALALVKCWVTIETGSERKALAIIEKFLEQLDRVSPDIRHSLEAHSASLKIWLRHADAESYFARVNASLESAGQIENLLIMHLRKIMQNLHRAEYSEARARLEETIKIARESRIYYRLAHAYVQLSAVYYETGDYARALEYLDLGYRLTVSVGRDTWTGGHMMRYSMIYKKLGLYGLSIKAVHRALRRPAVRSNPQDRLRLYLTLFELYNEIGSGLARGCRKRCESLLANCGDVVLNAWYACETGVFMQGRGDLAAAEKYYKTAVDQCKRAGMRDDEALVRIRLANLYVETGRFAPADAQARSVKRILRSMESAALENRSRLLELSLEYARRSGRAALGKQVERCEQIRPGITDVGLAVDADALLFRAQARLGKLEESKRYFDSYFKTIKKIASGLAGVTDLDTLRVGPDFDLMVHEYRLVLARLDAARRTTPC